MSQFVQIYVHLRHPTFQPHGLRIFCFILARTSTVTKLVFCLIGSLTSSPTQRLFIVFISFDYLGIALFHWWLVRYTIPGLQLRLTLKRMAWFLSGIASISCLITVLAYVFNRSLFPVGVSASNFIFFTPTLISPVTSCSDQCLKFAFSICSVRVLWSPTGG